MQATLQTILRHLEGGRTDLAEVAASHARARFPATGEFARLHGIALLTKGDATGAVSAFHESLRLDPKSIESRCNLASAELAQNNADAALVVLDEALRLAPQHPAVLNGLGNARRAAGDLSGSRDAYLASTRAAPNHLGAWLNLAAAELALQNNEVAEHIARSLLSSIAHPKAWILLGQALLAQKRAAEAEKAFAEGERLDPQDPQFAYQIGLAADEQKNFEDAAIAHARALKLDPQMHSALAQLVFTRRQVCDWTELETLSDRLRQSVAVKNPGITPFGFLAEPATAAEQLQCARTFANQLGDALASSNTYSHLRRENGTPLRIGFASNGFGNHPTGLLTVAMFEALRERNIELHLFATAAEDGKDIQQRLRTAASEWHLIAGLSPRAMAERIHASGVEILIDLRVWGGGNISDALALRPAPIQINWLAYPGTSGAAWIDYVLADRIALPDAMRAHYSEKVAYLPRCFQPSDPTREIGQPPSRIECDLPESGPVYVCFNNSYKLDPRSVTRMFAILRAVPESVLWLLSGPGKSNERLRALAGENGVEPSRLVFMKKLPHAEYLSRYRHADLFLDTANYNAHTTASDAIWAGCPVLSVPGETFASRVAASLNHHLGMPDLNVADDQAFVDFAVRIGRDREARKQLRERLALRRIQSGLFDMRAFAKDFLVLLEQIADRHRCGLRPIAID